jgi:hypothetical protein
MNEEVDYGPLAQLAGTWQGSGGLDISPEPEGQEVNPYFETLLFEKAGDVTNAGKQTLAVMRYHQVVSRQSDKKVFHNESGYWLWDKERKLVMQALTIPRGVSLVAGGRCEGPGSNVLEVRAAAGDADWGIAQAPFMRDNAKTVGFTHKISVSGETLTYSETTSLEIYGKRFEHTDENKLTRKK